MKWWRKVPAICTERRSLDLQTRVKQLLVYGNAHIVSLHCLPRQPETAGSMEEEAEEGMRDE